MVPKYQAVIKIGADIHCFNCSFARFLEPSDIATIQTHYASVPSFELYWDKSNPKLIVHYNINCSMDEVMKDFKSLLEFMGIKTILWSQDIIGDTIKSEDLTKVLAANNMR